MLTQERIRELFDYQDGDLLRLVSVSNNAKVGEIAGSLRADGYVAIGIDGKIYKHHRIVWLYHHGFMPENGLDHINQDKKDNRIENLREVSNQCNLRNCDNRKTNKSGVKGVSWARSVGKWRAEIKVDFRSRHLGLYSDFNEAVLARLATEQCLGWAGCDSSSPAYQYCKREKLIRE